MIYQREMVQNFIFFILIKFYYESFTLSPSPLFPRIGYIFELVLFFFLNYRFMKKALIYYKK